MMPGNPVVGGTALRIPAIQSPNYNPATGTGWAIFANGTAVFYGLTITDGVITGPDYIINPSGAFFYSGTPALGNLLASVTPGSGTDSEGNAYLAGFTVYDGSAYIQVHVNSSFGAPAIEMPTGAGSEEDHGAIYTAVANALAVNEYPYMNIFGPGSADDNTQAGITLVASAKNGASLVAGELVLDDAGTVKIVAYWNASGFYVTANNDGNTYSTGKLWKQATSTTINSTTPIAITGLSYNVAASTYRLHGFVIATVAAAGATQPGTLRLNGTATASAVDVWITTIEPGLAGVYNMGLITAQNADPSFTSGAWPLSSTIVMEVDGIVQFSAAGTFNVYGRVTTSGSDASWTATAGSWMILEPLN
jgi:hypothetical protein